MIRETISRFIIFIQELNPIWEIFFIETVLFSSVYFKVRSQILQQCRFFPEMIPCTHDIIHERWSVHSCCNENFTSCHSFRSLISCISELMLTFTYSDIGCYCCFILEDNLISVCVVCVGCSIFHEEVIRCFKIDGASILLE